MTTKQILLQDRNALKQVNDAIKALSTGRSKDMALRKKFIELRKNLLSSIESNERALKLGCF